MKSELFFELPREMSVGIIGAGFVSQTFHLPILDHLSDVSVAYIADIDETRALDLAAKYGTRGVVVNEVSSLPPCDVVFLAIPVGFRDEYIQEFADRGTPIFAEKPFATDVSTQRIQRDGRYHLL